MVLWFSFGSSMGSGQGTSSNQNSFLRLQARFWSYDWLRDYHIIKLKSRDCSFGFLIIHMYKL